MYTYLRTLVVALILTALISLTTGCGGPQESDGK
jgi:hypothetical protein